MSRPGALILAVCLVSSAAAQDIPTKGTEATLDVATWNIEHFGNAGSGPSDDERQFENVKQVILQAEIDLWAVQEIDDPADFDQLIAELGDEWKGERDRASSNAHVGFIYKSDVIRLRKIGNILTGFAGSFAGRPPLQMEVDVTLGDTIRTVTFITLHMKCCSDAASYTRRTEASTRLKNHIDFTTLNTQPVIVLGDWNDKLTGSITAGRGSPFENFLSDPDEYSFPTLAVEQAGKNTFCFTSTCSSGSTIDHILITDELFEAHDTTAVFDDLLTALSSYVSSTSDHLPVFARFSFPTNTSITKVPEDEFGIRSIYPHPVASRATIDYSMVTGGNVVLEIRDLLGRRVAILEDGFLPAGVHRTELESDGLAAGTYFIFLQVDGARAVRPFFVAR